jgi:hypothetical protein
MNTKNVSKTMFALAAANALIAWVIVAGMIYAANVIAQAVTP